ncbi:GNAT family N-acetyltransferase, partial [Allofranklinella schreckenbergeri]
MAEPDAGAAAAVTQWMAQVFEHGEGSSAERMQNLLRDERFWLFGAFAGDRPVSRLSAHVLPLTSQHGAELFIYDIAVAADFQRRGIGRQLMQAALGRIDIHPVSSADVQDQASAAQPLRIDPNPMGADRRPAPRQD